MSCNFISGKPGGGKTLYAMRLIRDEIKLTKRKIITNIRIHFDSLNEYLSREGVDPGCHICDRITIIEEEQMREFYRYRGGGLVLTLREHQAYDGKKMETKVADFSEAAGGVLYVLDEVHIAFNSRQWASTGQGVIYYLSQHRKLGDDVILITQSVQNVDKQMRSFAQDFTYVRNLKKEKAGFFKLPGVFMRRTYLEPATATTKACDTKTFTLDVSGIANCYDTAAGVGIIGRSGADTKEKIKGLPWYVFLIIIGAVIWGLFHFVPRVIGAVITPKGMAVKHVQSALPFQSSQLGSQAGAIAVATTALVTNVPAPGVAVSVTGYYRRLDGCWRICFSDGAMLVVGPTEFQDYGRYVQIRGVRVAAGRQQGVSR